MKRLLFHLCYWFAGIIALSLILLSVNYTFGQAFLTSCSILPGVLMAKYLGRGISSAPKKEAIKQYIYLSLAILFTMYLFIFCIHWFLLEMDTEAILLNPVFILVIVAAYTTLNIYLEQKVLTTLDPEPEHFIDFISDRKKVRLELNTIKYIESNNDEVMVCTVSGHSYRTKMKISRWAEVLDSRFVRIHRSYIVNKDLITNHETDCVFIGDERIEISRKYRDSWANSSPASMKEFSVM